VLREAAVNVEVAASAPAGSPYWRAGSLARARYAGAVCHLLVGKNRNGRQGSQGKFSGAINDTRATVRADKGTVMDWARILAYVTGTEYQDLLDGRNAWPPKTVY
jgi:hypothetical protein